MPKEKVICCPYYVTRSRQNKTYATITCDCLANLKGIEIKNKLEFRNHEERNRFVEYYCAKKYEQCPYYRALYQRGKI